jgi:hypothetical protein
MLTDPPDETRPAPRTEAVTDALGTRTRRRAVALVCLALIGALVLANCQNAPATPTRAPTPSLSFNTPTPTLTPTLAPALQQPFQTYAYGELLPDMRVPVQRSTTGEGGWYAVIGTEEGWAQFLSQMGQPVEIWRPVQWDQEVLIGALLGVRQGRGHGITITDLDIDGVNVVADVSMTAPSSEQLASSWVTYPFHLIRVPRTELPLGRVTFRFDSDGQALAEQAVDMIDLSILWLPGEVARYPTPTSLPSTSTPEPTFTSTPIPHLQVMGTVLEVITDTVTLRIVPYGSDWQYVDLMEATSIFAQEGQPVPLAQLVPGTTIAALGYPGEGRAVRAAHIDVLGWPSDPDVFAPYHSQSVALSTIYDGYSPPLAVDGISATLPVTQTLSPTQTNVLTRNGFVVLPGIDRSFAAAYAVEPDPVEMGDPLFISADSVLHISNLLYDRALRSAEQSYLLPELRMLDRELFELSWSQYESASPSTTQDQQRIANAALLNATYYAVPLSLLDPDFAPPDIISPVVRAELSLIAAREGITTSPLLDLPGTPEDQKLQVDYGRFAPTGYYARDASAIRFFQALTWHRAIALRPDERNETRAAALTAYTLRTHSAPRVLWQRVHALLAFFHGRDASFTPAEYDRALVSAWGESPDIASIADEVQMDAFVQEVRDLPLPENPMWTIMDTKSPIDRDWRFLSQPFVIDTYVFASTTGDRVGDVENSRLLPSCIDLAAVLGSLEAYRVAAQTGDADYVNYVEQVDKVRNELSALRAEHWTEDLHWTWLYVYRALLEEKNASYPNWMHTTAWKRKQLQSMFGSWTQIRNGADAPGSFAPAGATEMATPSWGYVEPQPEVYARLASLTHMILDGLESRLMLSPAERDTLLELEDMLVFLRDAARRELTSQALTGEEYERLAEFGSLTERLTYLAQDSTVDSDDENTPVYDEAIATHVATAQGERLTEAIGRVDELYVVVEYDREPHLTRGGAYSHYEFAWAGADPLSDASWRETLDPGAAPARPLWATSFVIAE